MAYLTHNSQLVKAVIAALLCSNRVYLLSVLRILARLGSARLGSVPSALTAVTQTGPRSADAAVHVSDLISSVDAHGEQITTGRIVVVIRAELHRKCSINFRITKNKRRVK